MDSLDERLEETARKKYDFGYRTEELCKTPVETIKEEELEEFMAELKEVSDGVCFRLKQARLKSCRSLKRWEKSNEMLCCIVHRLLANPVYLKMLSAGLFEDMYDSLLKWCDP